MIERMSSDFFRKFSVKFFYLKIEFFKIHYIPQSIGFAAVNEQNSTHVA